MSMLKPSEWLNMNNNKELKRITKKLNDNKSYKFQLVLMIITIFLPILFQEDINKSVSIKITLSVLIPIIIIFIAFSNQIITAIKHRKSSILRKSINDLVQSIDEEVIYNLLASLELFDKADGRGAKDKSIKNILLDEAVYHLEKSVGLIIRTNNDFEKIYGNYRPISWDRIKHLTDFAKFLIKKKKIDDNLHIAFNSFCVRIENHS